MKKSLVSAAAFVAGLLLGGSVSAFAGPRADPVDSGEDRLVTGIGGVFFKARSPEKLREWYREHLGVEAGPHGADFLWREQDDPERVGRTVWSIFPEETDYFGSPEQRLMINYRVPDLDALLAKLAGEGIHPVQGPEDYSYGRFAWIVDGEGNRVELWEPAGEGQ